ncbi:hypothetical protein [Actinoplanes sp. NPDC089786]|uniref:hypothetical protein n=1 Tax=Actinoplanes sp. NPDC089786 TaxID=3155185 RepID=UPI003424F859
MTADPSRVAAAHTLLAQLGVTVADLQATPDHTRRMPTVAEYLPRVMAAATPSSCRTYGTYWTRMAAVWGDWPLDTVAARIVRLAAKFDNNARQALPLIGHPHRATSAKAMQLLGWTPRPKEEAVLAAGSSILARAHHRG